MKLLFWLIVNRNHMFNPFTAPACKISGLKDARTRLQTVPYFRSYTPAFNAVRFDNNPFTCQCETEDKKAKGFRILFFYWSFSSKILAVKGLNMQLTTCLRRNACVSQRRAATGR